MRRNLATLIVLVAATAANPARAQNTSSISSADCFPNITAAGIDLAIQGDDNGDATASVTYRPAGGAEAWTGHSPVRLDQARFTSSLFYLEPVD